MRPSRRLLLTITGLSVLSAPLLAGPSTPDRPLLDAARRASPTARWRASQHVRQAYPGLPADLVSQLRAEYPTWEHGVVDAILQTWQAHPDLAASLAKEIEARHGAELAAARQDVAQVLEATYPNFRSRLGGVLKEKGILPTWQAFVADYDPGLAERLRAKAPNGWRPGLLRDSILNDSPGSLPVLRSVASMPQGRAAHVAAELSGLLRQRAPGLAADFTQRWLDSRRELRDTLEAEFPGAGELVAETLQARHPQLVSRILTLTEPRTREARADLVANLDRRLPGFTSRLESLLLARYPNLRPELLSILKG